MLWVLWPDIMSRQMLYSRMVYLYGDCKETHCNGRSNHNTLNIYGSCVATTPVSLPLKCSSWLTQTQSLPAALRTHKSNRKQRAACHAIVTKRCARKDNKPAGGTLEYAPDHVIMAWCLRGKCLHRRVLFIINASGNIFSALPITMKTCVWTFRRRRVNTSIIGNQNIGKKEKNGSPHSVPIHTNMQAFTESKPI